MALWQASRRLGSRVLEGHTLPLQAAVALQLQQQVGFQGSGSVREPQHPKPVPLSKMKDSFLDGTSSTYLEELEERFRSDPHSVDKTWASFFNSLGTGTWLLRMRLPAALRRIAAV